MLNILITELLNGDIHYESLILGSFIGCVSMLIMSILDSRSKRKGLEKQEKIENDEEKEGDRKNKELILQEREKLHSLLSDNEAIKIFKGKWTDFENRLNFYVVEFENSLYLTGKIDTSIHQNGAKLIFDGKELSQEVNTFDWKISWNGITIYTNESIWEIYVKEIADAIRNDEDDDD